MRVAVVGAGIAGLTAALRLSQRGYDVTVYEAKDVLGGNLSSQNVDGVYHDVYPHMFCDWYVNFWEVFESDLGLDRQAHFDPRTGVKVLRKGDPYYLGMKNPTTLRSIWRNLRSGILPFPDMFLLAFSTLDLAGQQFDESELLSGLSVNGFLYSRPYASDRCAELHDFILMEIWSIHGNLTSASSYKDFIKRTVRFPSSAPFAWMLKGSLQEKLIGPFERKLLSLGCTIRTLTGVAAVHISQGKPEIELISGERQSVDSVVLAVPPEALANLVMKGEQGTRIVDRLPDLAELRRLRAERIAVVDLYFKRKLPGIPKDHVGLRWSDCDLTFLDLSQLWTDDPNMRDRTVLVLAASDFYALPSDTPEEDGYMMIKKLHGYLPVFDPGKYWGDPKSDVCWEKSRVVPNMENKLFINEVGSWGWRPQAGYDALPNVFFAGDFCRTNVDMATIEAAVLSGLHAARAVWKEEPLGDPIVIGDSEVHGDAAFIAMKLALLPAAYWAKWWSIVFDAAPYFAEGDVPRGLVAPAADMIVLPLAYTLDWWGTAYNFWKTVVYGATSPVGGKPTSKTLRGGAGSIDTLPNPYHLASQLWARVRSVYADDDGHDPDEGASRGSYQRRWRVKR